MVTLDGEPLRGDAHLSDPPGLRLSDSSRHAAESPPAGVADRPDARRHLPPPDDAPRGVPLHAELGAEAGAVGLRDDPLDLLLLLPHPDTGGSHLEAHHPRLYSPDDRGAGLRLSSTILPTGLHRHGGLHRAADPLQPLPDELLLRLPHGGDDHRVGGGSRS